MGTLNPWCRNTIVCIDPPGVSLMNRALSAPPWYNRIEPSKLLDMVDSSRITWLCFATLKKHQRDKENTHTRVSKPDPTKQQNKTLHIQQQTKHTHSRSVSVMHRQRAPLFQTTVATIQTTANMYVESWLSSTSSHCSLPASPPGDRVPVAPKLKSPQSTQTKEGRGKKRIHHAA